jgi:hypothetical protein
VYWDGCLLKRQPHISGIAAKKLGAARTPTPQYAVCYREFARRNPIEIAYAVTSLAVTKSLFDCGLRPIPSRGQQTLHMNFRPLSE